MGIVIFIGLVIGIINVESKAHITDPGVFIFFGWGIIGTIILNFIKCPNCNTSVVYQGTHFGIPILSGFVGKKCKTCGTDFCSR